MLAETNFTLEGWPAFAGLLIGAFLIVLILVLVVKSQLKVKIGPIEMNTKAAADKATLAYDALNGMEPDEPTIGKQVRMIRASQDEFQAEVRTTLSDVTATLLRHGGAIEANRELLAQHAENEEAFGAQLVERLGSLETVLTNIAGRVTSLEEPPAPPKRVRSQTARKPAATAAKATTARKGKQAS